MSEAISNVVVLNQSAHGIPASELVAAIRERLPEADVAFAETPADERELLPDADVVAGGSMDEEMLSTAENLQYFACSSAGVGHLPLDAFEERGVAVTNASGVHGPNIAEHVVGWMLMLARRLDEGIRRQRRREWRHFQAFDEFQGSTVTVVGLGSIGQAIVQRLQGFEVDTIGVRYTPEKGGPTDEVVGFDDLEEVLPRTDYLALACPLTDVTEGLIGEDEFRVLPNDAVVVNIGRGPIVETDALLGALRGNKIHAAALDVTDPEPLPEDHPLWNLENVLITPHNSGHTPHYFERCADILARNVEHIEETGGFDDLENRVA
jgi:phosphoglycerate dehydrogenase-like enzyme